MPSLHIEAPTDSQLVYLRGLCEERGIEPHEIVVGSKADASACIAAILARTSLEPWVWDDAGFWAESVPF